MTIGKEFRSSLFKHWNDPNREKKIKAALDLKIFSLDDICKAGLFHREYVTEISLKHCPDDHDGNLTRHSSATPQELEDLREVLGVLKVKRSA